MILLPVAVVAIAFVLYDLTRSKRRVDVVEVGGSSSRGVVLALGRFEGRQLLRHPAFFAGLGFVAVGAVLIARGNDGHDLSNDVSLLILLLFPLAGMTIIAVSLMTLRARRDGTEELLASTPVSEDARTGSHLLTALWAMVVGAICTLVLLVSLYIAGAHGRPSIGELLVGPVLVGCAVAVGVTASRLLPSVAIGFIAVIAMGAFQGLTDHFSGPGTTRTSWFAPWVQTPEFIPDGIWPRRPWSHLVYLVGLGVFAAALGFLVRRRDGRRVLAVVAALTLIAAGGIVQSRPFPSSVAERAAAYVEHPSRVCRTPSDVEYCAYQDRAAMIDLWSPAVQNVVRVVPPSVRARRLRIVQRVSPLAIYHMPGSVLVRLSATTPSRAPQAWPPDGAIHPNMSWCTYGSACSLALATQVGAWAVGLPLDPSAVEWSDPYGRPEVQGYDSSGQARAVVALWLGAQSSPGSRALFRSRIAVGTRPTPDASRRGGEPFFVAGCDGMNETGTRFGVQDGLFAKQLLDLPDDRVARVFNENWSRFADPRTSSAEVAELFGLRRAEPQELLVSFSIC